MNSLEQFYQRALSAALVSQQSNCLILFHCEIDGFKDLCNKVREKFMRYSIYKHESKIWKSFKEKSI